MDARVKERTSVDDSSLCIPIVWANGLKDGQNQVNHIWRSLRRFSVIVVLRLSSGEEVIDGVRNVLFNVTSSWLEEKKGWMKAVVTTSLIRVWAYSNRETDCTSSSTKVWLLLVVRSGVLNHDEPRPWEYSAKSIEVLTVHSVVSLKISIDWLANDAEGASNRITGLYFLSSSFENQRHVSFARWNR